MASIDEYLEQILEARYGRDVRQSIHDGIKKCYEDGRAQPSSWGTLDGKPFEGIGTGLSVDQEGNLNAEGGGGSLPDNVAYLGEETIPSTPTPRDADTLGGQEPSYYAKQSDLNLTNDKLNIISTTHFYYAHFGSNSETFEMRVYKRYTKTINNIRKGVYLVMVANIVNESVSIADINFNGIARVYCGIASVFVGAPLMNLVRLENSFDIDINIQPLADITSFFEFDVFLIRIGD